MSPAEVVREWVSRFNRADVEGLVALYSPGATNHQVVMEPLIGRDAIRQMFVTEFGRMPTFQKGANGRDHNPRGFTVWLAGAGVKTPFSHGETDEFGYQAVADVATIYDLHATLLHLLGLDHQRLSFYHNGIERRLTDVHGHVIEAVLA